MLVFDKIGVVYLAVPKTATQSVQGELRRYAAPNPASARNHMTYSAYADAIKPGLTRALGRPPLTVAVIRDPLDRLFSWYRYRQNAKQAGTPTSTRGIGFDTFLDRHFSDDPPTFATVGVQTRFVGWDGTRAEVDYLFDYARLDLLQDFFAVSLQAPVKFGAKNVSTAQRSDVWATVPDGIRHRAEAALTAERGLYDAVRDAGCLMSATALAVSSSER